MKHQNNVRFLLVLFVIFLLAIAYELANVGSSNPVINAVPADGLFMFLDILGL